MMLRTSMLRRGCGNIRISKQQLASLCGHCNKSVRQSKRIVRLTADEGLKPSRLHNRCATSPYSTNNIQLFAQSRALHTAPNKKQQQALARACEDPETVKQDIDEALGQEKHSVAPDFKRDFKHLNTSFDNATEAYKSKSNAELLRAIFVFQMTSIKPLVTHNVKILKLLRKVLGQRLFEKLMKSSFYGQFVAGADVEDISPVLAKNYKYGVKSILDYSVEEDMPEEEAKQKTKEAFQASRRFKVLRPQQGEGQQANSSGQFAYHEQFGDRRKDVTSARTYFYDSEGQCEKNMWTFMKCVDVVSEATDSTGLAAIKLTALGRPQFLLQMSDVLTTMRQTFGTLTYEQTNVALKRIQEDTLANNLSHLGIPMSRDETKKWFTWLDINDSGEIDLYNWSSLLDTDRSLRHLFTVPNLDKGVLESKFPSLTLDQELELKNMLRRVNSVVEHAAERNVRVMVDAEQTYFQPAISRLTMEMMRKFNKEKAVVFNTYQCYLKNTHENILIDLDLAQRENFAFGCKVVRGAYMEQERERAASIGYEDPVNESFDATTAMYERVINTIMQEAVSRPAGKIAVMAATHNEDSVRFCVQRMKELGIRREDKVICFAQLLGMCDHISFPLGQSGYSVYKYVPYGPVEEVLPYLSRRVAENQGILEKVKKEKKMLWTEMRRRMIPGRRVVSA